MHANLGAFVISRFSHELYSESSVNFHVEEQTCHLVSACARRKIKEDTCGTNEQTSLLLDSYGS